jgi:hypothetical protein
MKIAISLLLFLLSCGSNFHNVRLATFYGSNGVNKKSLKFITPKEHSKFIDQLSMYFQSKPLYQNNHYQWFNIELNDLSSRKLQISIDLIDKFSSDNSYTQTFIGIIMSDVDGNDMLSNDDVYDKAKSFFQRIVDLTFTEKTKEKTSVKKVKEYKKGEVVFASDLDELPHLFHRTRVGYYPEKLEEYIMVEAIVDIEGKIRNFEFKSKASKNAMEAIEKALNYYRYTPGRLNNQFVEFFIRIPFHLKAID